VGGFEHVCAQVCMLIRMRVHTYIYNRVVKILSRPAIFRDEVSRSAVEEDQGGDASHPKHLTQPSFEVPQSVGHSKPRHLAEIVCKLQLALIRGHKDNFKRLASALYVAVCLGELWCEAAARRAPVCAVMGCIPVSTNEEFADTIQRIHS